MPGDVTVTIEGGKALEKALADLGDPVYMKRAARKALRTAAKPIVETAKSLVPVDEGDLRESIKQGAARKGRSIDSDYQVKQIVAIDRNVQPPREIEGRSKKYRDPGVAGVAGIKEFGGPDQPAQPFMLPAWDAEKGASTKRIMDTLGPAIEDQARKKAAKG
ncbi:MAG: HK97-gp10 family putative phage morphogenesis protein [Pontixanthobacter sp.]